MHLGNALAAVDAGGYVSIWKLLPIIVLLFLWSRVLTWIDKDALATHLPREALNTGIFLTGIVAFIAFFFIPNFWIALTVLVVALLVPGPVFVLGPGWARALECDEEPQPASTSTAASASAAASPAGARSWRRGGRFITPMMLNPGVDRTRNPKT